jgi:hypothetical protein
VAHHLVERVLPDVPIRQYVLSPPSELVGLLAARAEALSALSRIFTEAIFKSIERRLDVDSKAHCGAITFVQRFTKTVACYPHLHVLVLDGAYVEAEVLDFVEDPGPRPPDIKALEESVLLRFERWLRRHGYRYVTRPPFAEAQLQRLDEERVRLELRSPVRSGQKEIILHPLALLPHLRTSLRSGRGHVPRTDGKQACRRPRRVRRLAWLIPPPRQHQIRYAGLLAPNAALRPAVVPAGRISVQRMPFPTDRLFEPLTPEPYRVAWAQLLARVYDVDACACPACPGRLKPAGAVLPPHAPTWLRTRRIYPVGALAPPTGQRSLALPEVT